MNTSNISRNCMVGEGLWFKKTKVLVALILSLIVITIMSLTTSYTPLCDDFIISFKFTPHFDSSTKIIIQPSFDSVVNKNFRRFWMI